MYIFQNGDRCPCCGQELKDMSDRELEIFSVLMASHGIGPISVDLDGIEPIPIVPPPDAGIFPPVKPIATE